MLGVRRMAVACVAVTTVGFAAASAIRAQQIPPQTSGQNVFRGGVNLVQISVVATSADGQPVHGLTKDDFTILERGEARPIEGFAEINSPRPAASPFPATLAKDVSDNVSAKSDRVVILVVDDIHFAKVTDTVKTIARRVVEGLGDGTSIGIITSSGEFGMEPTTDRAHVLEVIDAFVNKVGVSGRGAPASAFGRGGDLAKQFGDLTMLKANQDVAHMLVGGGPQRKAFVWVSGGQAQMCPEPPEVRNYTGPSSEEHRCYAMLYEMQRANVSTYAVDPEQGHDGFLRGVTTETGGIIIRSNELATGLDRLIDDLNNYYLLGFAPPNPNDTHYREIDVRVSRPGVTLRYRRGYTAALPANVNTPKNLEPVAADVAGVLPKTDLRMRLSATPLAPAGSDGASPVAVTIEVHGDAARVVTADGWLRDAFKYELVAVDLKQKKPVLTRSEQRDIGWRPSIPQAGDVAYSVTTEISLQPGLYQLRASGQSRALQTDGSVYIVVDVPDTRASPLTLGGLLLGYATTPPIATVASGYATTLPFLPTVDRTLLSSDVIRLLCDFSRGAGIGDVDFLIEARDAFDHVVRTATKRIAAGETPRLDVKLSLDGLAPGAYLLRVTATSGVAHDVRKVGITVR